MAQGLQVFDENGNCTLDVTSRLCKVLGTLVTGTDDGHIENEAFKTNDYWVFDLEIGIYYGSGYRWYEPFFYQDKTYGVLTWSFNKDKDFKDGNKISRKVLYGVY